MFDISLIENLLLIITVITITLFICSKFIRPVQTSRVQSVLAENEVFKKMLVQAKENGTFFMYAEDVFSISGRGTIVTGKIKSGIVKVGDEIEIIGEDGVVQRTRVAGIEMFRKTINQAKEGESVGILLNNINKTQVRCGYALAQIGTVN